MAEAVVEDKEQCLVQQHLIEMLKVKLICPDLCHWRDVNTFEVQFTFILVFEV